MPRLSSKLAAKRLKLERCHGCYSFVCVPIKWDKVLCLRCKLRISEGQRTR